MPGVGPSLLDERELPIVVTEGEFKTIALWRLANHANPSFRGSAFLTTFYPDAQTVEEAWPVRVGIGGDAQVSITLRLARAVSVKATIHVPGEMMVGRAALNKRSTTSTCRSCLRG